MRGIKDLKLDKLFRSGIYVQQKGSHRDFHLLNVATRVRNNITLNDKRGTSKRNLIFKTRETKDARIFHTVM